MNIELPSRRETYNSKYIDPFMEILDDPNVSIERRLGIIKKLDLINMQYGIYKDFIKNFSQILFEKKNSREPASILEVGSGMAGLSREIFKWGNSTQRSFSLHLYDSQQDILDKSQLHLKNLGIDSVAHLATEDHLKIFPDNAFDYVVSLHVIHHIQPIENAVAAINQMLRVSKKGVYLMDFHRKFGSVTLFKIWNTLFGICEDLSSDGIKSMKRAHDPVVLLQNLEKLSYFNKFNVKMKTDLIKPYWGLEASWNTSRTN